MAQLQRKCEMLQEQLDIEQKGEEAALQNEVCALSDAKLSCCSSTMGEYAPIKAQRFLTHDGPVYVLFFTCRNGPAALAAEGPGPFCAALVIPSGRLRLCTIVTGNK